MEEESLKISKICRLCLCQKKLITVGNSEFATYFNNFNFIEVGLNFKLPKEICEKCLNELNRIASFIKKCRESHDILTRTVTEQSSESAEGKNDIVVKMSDHIGYIKKEEIDLDLEGTEFNSWQTASDCASNSNVATGNNSNDYGELLDRSTSDYINLVELSVSNNQSTEDDVKNYTGTNGAVKVCGRCGETVNKLADHYKENRICYPKNFKCELCDQGCNSDFALQRHKIAHHWNQISHASATCHICSKMFKHEHNLKRHILVHKYGKRFICELCGKRFTTNAVLKDHYNLHTGQKPHCCCYCGKTFSTAQSRVVHEKSHNKIKRVMLEDPLDCFLCEICNRQFSRMRFLKVHMKSHDDSPNVYKCKICKQTFETASLFRKHSTVHASEKPYSCSYCHKRFSERYFLIRHERVHTGERPFVCTVCNKSFSQETHLKRHTICMHEKFGEKPFKCKICDQGFTGTGSLKVHGRIHTGERPYSCHVCEKCFIDSSSRKKHVKAFHGEDEVKNIKVRYVF